MGLSAMHTLFAREHNAVCDALRATYPSMSEERIYQTARLVVSALIAKIHTVEWTPAILATEAIDIGLHTNWQGPPKNWLNQLGLWLFEAHSQVGIPKTLPDHHGVPYSLTEDFVTVYRMHPLIPDDFELRDHHFGQRQQTVGFLDIQAARPRRRSARRDWRTRCTRSASPTRVRSPCTTSRARCSGSNGTARSSICPSWTSYGRGGAVSRATTTSVPGCTSSASAPSRN